MNTKGTIGVITNDAASVFQREVIEGIRTLVNEYHFDLEVDSLAVDPSNRQPIRLPLSEMAGFLVIANVLADEELHDLYQTGKPLSLVSHQLKDVPVPAVIPDNAGGVAQLVDYLIDTHNRKRIAFIEGDLNQNDGRERTAAFRRQLIRHDMLPDERLFLRGDFIPAVAAESVRGLLDSGIEFDAIAGADYLLAIAALDVLQEAGVRVPNSVSVVGFGDGPEADEAGLTTVGIDVVQIGIRAGRQLMGQIQGLEMCGVTLLSTSIVERDTC